MAAVRFAIRHESGGGYIVSAREPGGTWTRIGRVVYCGPMFRTFPVRIWLTEPARTSPLLKDKAEALDWLREHYRVGSDHGS